MNQCYLDFIGFALADFAKLLLTLIIEIFIYLHFIYKLSLSVVILGTYVYIYAYVQHVGACTDIIILYLQYNFIYFFSECLTAFLTLRQMLGESLPFLLVEVRVFSHILFSFLANLPVYQEHHL